MKQEMNYSRYVDRYLDNVMSSEEHVWFEKELEGNLELQNEVKLQKSLHAAISDRETFALKEQLELIHEQLYNPWTTKIRISKPVKKAMSIVAGIAVLMLAFALLFVRQIDNTSSSELYAQYFKPAEVGMSFRTSGNEVSNDLRTAMMLYESKRFEEAIGLFEKILEEDESRIGLNLYSGISHMEVKQYNEANIRFRKIIDHKSNAFIESAEWYLGLCYLLTEDDTKAKEVFANIADHKSYYSKDAKKILNKLK